VRQNAQPARFSCRSAGSRPACSKTRTALASAALMMIASAGSRSSRKLTTQSSQADVPSWLQVPQLIVSDSLAITAPSVTSELRAEPDADHDGSRVYQSGAAASPTVAVAPPATAAPGSSNTSIAEDFPHHRHVTDSTASSRTSSSSIACSPPRVKCQKARVRRVDTTSNRVRFPQPRQR